MKIGINSGLPSIFTVSAASSSCLSLLHKECHLEMVGAELLLTFLLPPGILPITSYLTLPTGFPTEPQA